MFIINILVVDDEIEIANLLEIYLLNEGYKVFKYYDSSLALKEYHNLDIDLAILDIMMPNLNGFEFAVKIRRNHTFPIIFLSAKVEDVDKIQGLSIGADDYITKPFQPMELVARVKAQLRRYTRYNNQIDESHIIELRGIMINKRSRKVSLNNQEIKLTPIQFDILCNLLNNAGEVVSTDELFLAVWKEKYYESDNNTVMVHIRNLREKLKDTNKHSKYIKTVWGVGYTIEK